MTTSFIKKENNELLAKSYKNLNSIPDWAKLSEHLKIIYNFGKKIFSHRGRQAYNILGLENSSFSLERLDYLLGICNIFHDLGKANDCFQKFIKNPYGYKNNIQLFRHEFISSFLLLQEPFFSFLKNEIKLSEEEIVLVVAAILGHHIKFEHENYCISKGCGTTKTEIFLSSSPSVKNIFLFLQEEIKKEKNENIQIPVFSKNIFIKNDNEMRKTFQDLRYKAEFFSKQNPYFNQVLGFLKLFVINSDVAGSILSSNNYQIEILDRLFSSENIEKEIENIISKKLNGNKLLNFQKKVANSQSLTTFIEAGCGSGKTIAAYCWFKKYARDGKTLWMAYPSTGTALEGFRGYLNDRIDLEVDLESCRREVDIEIFNLFQLKNSEDDDLQEKIEAIRYWQKNIVVCTADTILGLLQFSRKSIYAFPSLCNSVIVFDEIHSYDDRMFCLLCDFLKYFPKIPVLLMTASLSEEKKKKIKYICEKYRNEKLFVVLGPRKIETTSRYQIHILNFKQKKEIWKIIRQELENDKKILFITNTVNSAIENYKIAKTLFKDFPCYLYHSRFKYPDRVRKHRDIISAFSKPGGCLAFCTQVAEMSLDISADVLFTEVAPIPSLIQRLGRLNRYAHKEKNPSLCPCFVLPIHKSKVEPYTKEEIDESYSWLKNLSKRNKLGINQKHLLKNWLNIQKIKSQKENYIINESLLFTSGISTYPGDVRDPTPSVLILLEEDIPIVKQDVKKLFSYVISMNNNSRISFENEKKMYGAYVFSKEKVNYSPEIGATWVKEKQKNQE